MVFGRFWLLRDAFDDEPSLLAELSDELLLLFICDAFADGDGSEVIELLS